MILFIILLGVNNAYSYFFENSRRRASSETEQSFLGKLGNCTGFFVRNNQSKNLLITAKHCLNYEPQKFCESEKTISDIHYKVERKCKSVAISSHIFDIVMLELDGDSRDQKHTLVLGNFLPKKNTWLKLIGFPIDKYSKSGANTSENCWVNSEEVVYPFKNSKYWKLGLKDPAMFHNCSVYAGNSGGPLLVEGTNIVIGQPFQYSQGVLSNRGGRIPTATFSLMANFVQEFFDQLVDYEVEVTEEIESRKKEAYLKSTVYKSLGECDLNINVEYLTKDKPSKLKVTYLGQGCFGSKDFLCKEKICQNGREEIHLMDDHFVLKDKNETGVKYFY